MKIIYLVNPVSPGIRGDIHSYIKQGMEKAGVDRDKYSINETSRSDTVGQARDAFQEADTVIGVGGDGTISAIVEGLIRSGETGKKVGIYPGGTGNDLCRHYFDMKKLRKDPADYFAKLAEGNTVDHSVWEVGGRIFLNYVSVGYDAVIAYKFNLLRKQMKKTPGRARNYIRYVLLGLKNFWRSHADGAYIESGGKNFRALKVLLICNITKYAAGAHIEQKDNQTLSCLQINGLFSYIRLMLTHLTKRPVPNITQTFITEGVIKNPGEGVIQIDGEGLSLADLPAEMPFRFKENINLLVPYTISTM